MSALNESQFSEPIAEFTRMFNGRVSCRPAVGERWVRLRPPDAEDLKMVQEDGRLLPFMRVGSECRVTEVLAEDKRVTVQIKDSLMLGSDYFLSSFVRVVKVDEWETPEEISVERVQLPTATPGELEALLIDHLQASRAKGVRLHGPDCTQDDCLDPFSEFGGRRPMSTERLARQVNTQTGKNFTSAAMYGFLLGIEGSDTKNGADPAFYNLGQTLREAYTRGF